MKASQSRGHYYIFKVNQFIKTYLVSESTRSETSSNRCGASVSGELEDSALAEGTRRDNEHVCWILNSDYSAGGQHQLLPRTTKIDHVGAVCAAFVHIRLHLNTNTKM